MTVQERIKQMQASTRTQVLVFESDPQCPVTQKLRDKFPKTNFKPKIVSSTDSPVNIVHAATGFVIARPGETAVLKKSLEKVGLKVYTAGQKFYASLVEESAKAAKADDDKNDGGGDGGSGTGDKKD